MEARWLPNTGANQALIVILFFIRPILREREERRSNSGSNSQFVVHQRGGWKRVLAKAIALSLVYRRGVEGT
jgi:hypothetical protein